MSLVFRHMRGARVKPTTVKIQYPRFRLANWLWIPWKIIQGMVWLCWQAVQFWWATLPALTLLCLWSELGTVGSALLLLILTGVVGGWAWAHPASFRPVAWFFQARWRAWWVYDRQWYSATATCGLAIAFSGAVYYPQILKVTRDAWGDILTVRMVAGQHPDDWSGQAGRLAHTFKALGVTISPVARHVDLIEIRLRMKDPLSQPISRILLPPTYDFAALPVAVREDGRVHFISIRQHVLIAGATGAGKGSVQSAILAALGPGIQTGLVQVHGFDPKGGMELAFSAPLFHRFYYDDPESMAGALEDLVKDMNIRTNRLRGVTRTHQATIHDPTIVILVDEFASLTAYVGDKKIKERIIAAMSQILSKGRAVGVHVIAALQDPRKEILPFRNLFGTRIALRLKEEPEVNMVLGEGASERGAACHHIPVSLPGVGFVVLETSPQPMRVRFPYHSDHDIHALAAAFRPHPTLWNGQDNQP